MPTALTFAVGQTADFNQPLREIAVSVGTVVVSQGGDTETVKGPEGKLDCKDLAGHHIYSPDGAAFSIVYSDEPPAPTPPKRKSAGTAKAPKKAKGKTKVAPRGDSSKSNSTGSLDARTRDQLRKLAKKRKVKGYSGMSKEQLIKALRS